MFEVQPILDTESYAVHFYELLSRVKYDKKRKEVQRLEHLIKRLEHGYDDWGEYRLNNLIDTVIKKIEFADKFNFETWKECLKSEGLDLDF